MKLFHAWLSSASRRVRLCLAEKNMDYEGMAVDLRKQEQHAPEFLAMNPNGVVPALQLSPGRFLYESSTICEYLDEVQPDPPLRPGDPYDRAVMRNFVRWTDDHALPNLLILNWSLMLQPTAMQWTDAQLQEKLARIPTPERRQAWVRIARQPYSEQEKAAALAKLLELVGKMEAMLALPPNPPASSSTSTSTSTSNSAQPSATQRWLVGGQYSLADIAAAPFIARIAEIAPEILSLDSAQPHPQVLAWWRAMQERPAFVAARFDRFGAL